MPFINQKHTRAALTALLCAVILPAAKGLAQAPYYAGKTITLVRGGGAGGSGE